MYERFPEVYDAFFVPHSLAMTQVVFEKLVAPRLGERTWLLDVGCGTGEFAALVNSETLKAVGFDKSATLLEHARRKHPSLAWVNGDARRMCFARRFNAATAMFEVMNHFSHQSQVDRVFRSVNKALIQGSIFVFDYLSEDAFVRLWRSNALFESSDLVISIESSFNQAKHLGSMKIDVKRQEDGFELGSLVINEWSILNESKLFDSLTRSGFTEVEFLDAQTDLGIENQAGRWIVRCRSSTAF